MTFIHVTFVAVLTFWPVWLFAAVVLLLWRRLADRPWTAIREPLIVSSVMTLIGLGIAGAGGTVQVQTHRTTEGYQSSPVTVISRPPDWRNPLVANKYPASIRAQWPYVPDAGTPAEAVREQQVNDRELLAAQARAKREGAKLYLGNGAAAQRLKQLNAAADPRRGN